ncbi:MAG TPA: hypothetical protein VFU76_16390 [Terriglobales bacterium]|nr:hypothetical protein [Terriglobales bacterium]
MKSSKRTTGMVIAALLAAALAMPSSAAAEGRGHTLHHVFMTSARENADFTRVTLPLYRGTSGGQPVWYVITDASSRYWAEKLGVNYAPKLGNTAGGHGSQKVSGDPLTGIDFPATVDFKPKRVVDIGDYGECGAVPILPFGPDCFAAGAVGNPGYSPLVELADGSVLNASHIVNHTGKADKATVNADFTQATFDETEGRALGQVVHYISVDASVAPGAVLENVTTATELAKAPSDPLGPGDENASHLSAREGIIAFTNGQTGLDNPNRQGLNSTIVDGQAIDTDADNTISPPVPRNILQQVPNPTADPGFPLYSPLWDVHFTTWQVPYAERTLQNDFEAVRHNSNITNPAGGAFAPSGPIANCPIISIDITAGRDNDHD